MKSSARPIEIIRAMRCLLGALIVAVTPMSASGQEIRVAAVEVRGLEAFAPPIELPRLPLRVGEAYDVEAIAETERIVAAALADRGHLYADVEVFGAIDEVAGTVAVVLTVQPGPLVAFGEPEIVAAPPIRPVEVTNRLAFQPGEPFSFTALRETERRLRQVPIIEEVTIEVAGLDVGATVARPRITVTTRDPQGFAVEGSVSSVDCLEIAAYWRHRYFLGGPSVFSFGGGFSNLLARQVGGGFPCSSVGEAQFADPDYFVRADLRQPWPGDWRTALLLSGFFRRASAPQVYIRRGFGGQIGLARELTPALFGTIRYAPERNELDAAEFYFCANFGICDPALLGGLTGFNWLAPVEALVQWAPAGPPLIIRRPFPGEEWRWWTRASLEGAASVTGSDFEYFRSIGETALTRILGERTELAGRTRLAVLTGDRVLPPQLRLFSGGPGSVRGVPQNFLGPKVLVVAPEQVAGLGCALAPDGCPPNLLVSPGDVSTRPAGGDLVLEANLEGRFWVGGPVQLAAFLDWGLLGGSFTPPGGARGAEESEVLLTPGIGVRILTRFGPVRVDVGYDPSPVRRYPLFTSDPETDAILFLGTAAYDPFTFDNPSGWRELWRRLQLHLAIGAPF